MSSKNAPTIPLAVIAILLCLSPLAALAMTQPVNPNPSFDTLKDGILPKCNPASTQIRDGQTGCGLDAAKQLVYNIIKYITYIVIPIAALLLGYAGFTIMTAAGEAEKISQAKGMISKVVIGLVIIFLSTTLVRFIFNALEVSNEFKPN